jgi:hypothetical protein
MAIDPKVAGVTAVEILRRQLDEQEGGGEGGNNEGHEEDREPEEDFPRAQLEERHEIRDGAHAESLGRGRRSTPGTLPRPPRYRQSLARPMAGRIGLLSEPALQLRSGGACATQASTKARGLLIVARASPVHCACSTVRKLRYPCATPKCGARRQPPRTTDRWLERVSRGPTCRSRAVNPVSAIGNVEPHERPPGASHDRGHAEPAGEACWRSGGGNSMLLLRPTLRRLLHDFRLHHHNRHQRHGRHMEFSAAIIATVETTISTTARRPPRGDRDHGDSARLAHDVDAHLDGQQAATASSRCLRTRGAHCPVAARSACVSSRRGPLEKAHARFELPTYGQTASNEKTDVSTLLVSSITSTDAASPTVAATYSRATLL